MGPLAQPLEHEAGWRRQHGRLGRRWGLLLQLNGVVLPPSGNLICQVKDIGEIADLSARHEIMASIMEQLAARLSKVNSSVFGYLLACV